MRTAVLLYLAMLKHYAGVSLPPLSLEGWHSWQACLEVERSWRGVLVMLKNHPIGKNGRTRGRSFVRHLGSLCRRLRYNYLVEVIHARTTSFVILAKMLYEIPSAGAHILHSMYHRLV